METNIMPTQNMQKKIPYIFKDTHRKKTVFYPIQHKNGCLAVSDLFSYIYAIN